MYVTFVSRGYEEDAPGQGAAGVGGAGPAGRAAAAADPQREPEV